MAFDKESAKTPTAINRLRFSVLVSQTGETRKYDARMEVAIEMSDGSTRERVVEAIEPHLTAAQKTALKNFSDMLLDKARTEML